MATNLNNEEYSALKQILKDLVESDFMPPEMFASYVGAVFKPVDLKNVDFEEVIPLRKNPHSREYYGSEHYNMAVKVNMLDSTQLQEVQNQLLTSVIKTWYGPRQFELMNVVVDAIGQIAQETPNFVSTHTTVFDSYLKNLKTGISTEKDIKDAWTAFINTYANNSSLADSLKEVVRHVAPVMSNNFGWWESTTFTNTGLTAQDLLSHVSDGQKNAFDALGLSDVEQVQVSSSKSPTSSPKPDSLDFNI